MRSGAKFSNMYFPLVVSDWVNPWVHELTLVLDIIIGIGTQIVIISSTTELEKTYGTVTYWEPTAITHSIQLVWSSMKSPSLTSTELVHLTWVTGYTSLILHLFTQQFPILPAYIPHMTILQHLLLLWIGSCIISPTLHLLVNSCHHYNTGQPLLSVTDPTTLTRRLAHVGGY